MNDLPPLHTLPAFEAAARLGSFLAAAEALHLTPSAISHRIKQLEEHLGQPLFERRHRAVVLTAAGRRYLAVVREALLRLDEASAVLRAPRRERLRISAAPALGSKWLVARVAEYQQGHPDLEFTLGTTTGLRPLLNGEADIGLRYGEEEWPGLLAWKLFEERVFPVCSPTLAANLQTPTDLDGVRRGARRGADGGDAGPALPRRGPAGSSLRRRLPGSQLLHRRAAGRAGKAGDHGLHPLAATVHTAKRAKTELAAQPFTGPLTLI